jgi:hypothetical protein
MNLCVPTVLLKHVMPSGTHHDWLLVDPCSRREDSTPLWAGRVKTDSREWAVSGTWGVEQIEPHRRRYLTFEGPIGGERGRVARVDCGWFVPVLWGADRIVIALTMHHCQGRAELCRVDQQHWQAVLTGG